MPILPKKRYIKTKRNSLTSSFLNSNQHLYTLALFDLNSFINNKSSTKSVKMKTSFLFFTALMTMAYAMPVEDPHAGPKAAIRALDTLMKRQCGSSGCPCNEPQFTFCTDSCFCQTACCNSQSALCDTLPDVIASGGFCVGGSSG